MGDGIGVMGCSVELAEKFNKIVHQGMRAAVVIDRCYQLTVGDLSTPGWPGMYFLSFSVSHLLELATKKRTL